MAIVPMNDLLNRIKKSMNETPTDDDIKLVEDFTDTFTSLTTNGNEDWKAKYEELEKSSQEKYEKNDAEWRKRYTDRFMGKVEDIPEVKQAQEQSRAETITIDDLFTRKE